jgi:hypothetical protein
MTAQRLLFLFSNLYTQLCESKTNTHSHIICGCAHSLTYYLFLTLSFCLSIIVSLLTYINAIWYYKTMLKLPIICVLIFLFLILPMHVLQKPNDKMFFFLKKMFFFFPLWYHFLITCFILNLFLYQSVHFSRFLSPFHIYKLFLFFPVLFSDLFCWYFQVNLSHSLLCCHGQMLLIHFYYCWFQHLLIKIIVISLFINCYQILFDFLF